MSFRKPRKKKKKKVTIMDEKHKAGFDAVVDGGVDSKCQCDETKKCVLLNCLHLKAYTQGWKKCKFPRKKFTFPTNFPLCLIMYFFM